MRNLLTAALLGAMMTPLASNAQCKYLTNAYDKFEKTHRVETKARIHIYSLAADHLIFRRVGQRHFIDFAASVPGGTGGVSEGNAIKFLLADESVVEFRAVEYCATTLERVGNNLQPRLYCTYEADRERFVTLSSQPLVGIRIYYSAFYDDVNINARAAQEKVMQAARCLVDAAVQ